MVLPIVALLSGLLIPIKLTPAYFAIIATLIIGTISKYGEIKETITSDRNLYLPFIAFGASLLFACSVGLNPAHSIGPTLKLLTFFPLILVFALLSKENYALTIALTIALGQTITSLHTIGESAFPEFVRPFSHGQVTEAGQLALALFIALGGMLSLWNRDSSPEQISPSDIVSAICGVVCFLFLGFSDALLLTPTTLMLLVIVCSLYLIGSLIRMYRSYKQNGPERAMFLFFTTIALPLLTTALLLNLKRGPWFGVMIGLVVICIRLYPRLLLWGAPALGITAFGIIPIRERLFASSQHFYIQGGRSDLWELGYELMKRYPMGIGFDNSEILKNFTHNIPSYLDHFHSNIINISVELGWLGGMSYLWIFALLIWRGLRHEVSSRNGVLILCLTTALISWQVAGIVEYNFGDSEVFLLGILTMGLLIGSLSKSQTIGNSSNV